MVDDVFADARAAGFTVKRTWAFGAIGTPGGDDSVADAPDGIYFQYWILSGSQDDGSLYPDYDGFTVYCPSPVCTTISNAAREIRSGQRSTAPVADHDTAVTEFGTAVTLKPAANDIAYRTTVRPDSIDLDPSTTGGAFTPATDGTLTFTPAAGFAGRATADYTIRDRAGRRSNVATVTVTVKPDPAGVQVLASFEDHVRVE